MLLVQFVTHCFLVMVPFFLVFLALTPLASSFSWENCGESSDPIQLENLDVYENATKSLRVKASGNLTIDVNAPIKLQLFVMKKTFFGYIFVPCVDDIGSCSFNDLCALSPFKPGDECPEELKEQNIPCFCPIIQGDYGGTATVDLAKTKVPSWLEKGTYKVKVTLTGPSGRLACIRFNIKLK